jgi:hypothetical protein
MRVPGAEAPARSGRVKVQPFTGDLVPAVRAFNARLAGHGVRYQFPDSPVSRWLPHLPGRTLYQTYYAAVDEGGAVRGAYIIKSQDFETGGERRSLGFYHLPLSEGLVDRRYGAVGVQLLSDALKRQPELFVLGIGALEEPLARMVSGLGWKLEPVPLYVKIARPFRVARRLPHLRKSRARAAALDLAAMTGLASAGIRAAQYRPGRRPGAGTGVVVDAFGPWCDALWASAKSTYSLIGSRDAESLALLYPARDPRFIRLVVQQAGHPTGWAVLLDTQMTGHPYFGNLRVGSIVDCLAAPDAAGAVVEHATRLLEACGVDLIVSNQSAPCWGTALKSAGFLRAPSGFLFGASRALAARLSAAASFPSGFHLNRGDGDGPINL